MGKIKRRVRKREETTLERQIEWIEYYSANNFGIGVECTKCKKWRRVYEYKESHQVPEDFQCSNARIDGKEGSCNIPSNLTENDFAPDKYAPGSIVWAKFFSYPWWPGIVEDNPDDEQYRKIERGKELYHVTFFGDKVSRHWIEEQRLTPFLSKPKFTVAKKYKEKHKIAIEQAERANAMDIQERLKHFSFAFLYKGKKWPKADDLGTNGPDLSNDLSSTKEPSCMDIDSNDKMEFEGKICNSSKELPSRNGSDCIGLSGDENRPPQDEYESSCDATISSNSNAKSNLSTETKDVTRPCPSSQGSVEDSSAPEEESMEIAASEPNTILPGSSESNNNDSRMSSAWEEEYGVLPENNWNLPLRDHDETQSDDGTSLSSHEDGYTVLMQNRIHTDSCTKSDCSEEFSGKEDAFQVPSTHNEVFNGATDNSGSTRSNEGFDNELLDPDSGPGEGASSPDNVISGEKFILDELSLDWNNPNFRIYVYKNNI